MNQWTLLVGGLPVVFALSALTLHGLPLVAVALVTLFSVQFLVSVLWSAEANRITIIVLSCVYVLLAVGRLVQRRDQVVRLVREGTRTPLSEVSEEPVEA